jgi:Protein of unknown function (DUF1239).
VVLEEQNTLIRCAAVWLVATMLWLTGCKDELGTTHARETDPDSVPTMVSHQVQTIVSDNGTTRYRITTPLWLMYEQARDPHWVFPRGVVAQELDNNMQEVSTIRCDSAYYDKNTQHWSLMRNVRITNADGDVVLTDELFWDQSTHELYSEKSFIHVEKQGRVIEGYGYRSNEKFTTYELQRVEAIFPIDENKMPHP